MLNEILTILALSSIPAAFSLLLDYCLGSPGSDEPKTGSIFSFYTLWISKKTLGPGKINEIQESFKPLLSSPDPEARRDGLVQFNLTVLHEAKKCYTVQKALGMCLFCTNVWISLIAAAIFQFSLSLVFIDEKLLFLLIPIFSHSILRKF